MLLRSGGVGEAYPIAPTPRRRRQLNSQKRNRRRSAPPRTRETAKQQLTRLLLDSSLGWRPLSYPLWSRLMTIRPTDSADVFLETVVCNACGQVHQVDPKTGRVVGNDYPPRQI